MMDDGYPAELERFLLPVVMNPDGIPGSPLRVAYRESGNSEQVLIETNYKDLREPITEPPRWAAKLAEGEWFATAEAVNGAGGRLEWRHPQSDVWQTGTPPLSIVVAREVTVSNDASMIVGILMNVGLSASDLALIHRTLEDVTPTSDSD